MFLVFSCFWYFSSVQYWLLSGGCTDRFYVQIYRLTEMNLNIGAFSFSPNQSFLVIVFFKFHCLGGVLFFFHLLLLIFLLYESSSLIAVYKNLEPYPVFR